ncbi:MAG: single-stranded-DNA-specific exonuclease RecJ [Clostridiales bacterium]|nr:single-stranded-DNA-specific exonuclease RecJ [Clostridiales bacterium]
MRKKWEYKEINEDKISEISKRFNVPYLLAKVIANREFGSEEEISRYLNTDISNLYDPYLIKDMEIGVDRVIKAINNKEKILVYGDYDVDGITSITVVKKFFEDLGINILTYLPNRLDEGYGLNKLAIDEIQKMNVNLIITVDCGISAIDEVEYANSKRFDVIITDHHECGEILPNAYAIINPKRDDSEYPFKQLAGVGVAFKFIQAISKKLNLPEDRYLKYLDIVCIGTIADIVPLIDENRIIAKNGLELLKNTKNIGVRALINKCGFNHIDSSVISFGLSPRINACGRIGNPQTALDLFLTNDVYEAEKLANELNEANYERQAIEKKIFENAKELIAINKLDEKPIIVLGNENWHHGVIGIVASKLVELYYKPCVLICFEGDEGKGSGRSIAGFDLFSAISDSGELLEKYGGHEMAVGLSINRDNYYNFKDKMNEYAEKNMMKDPIPVIKVDSEVKSDEISLDTINALKVLEPFGEKNSLPVFVYKNIKIDSIRTLSDGKHLKLYVKDNQTIYDAIGFNLGYLKDEFRCGDKVDILMTLEINRFNNTEKIQFNIKDIMKSI